MENVRFSKRICTALNKQMSSEAAASQNYLAYAVWASGRGYGGIAEFLFRHANEERDHMMKILRFILEREGIVSIEPLPSPSVNPGSILDCFEQLLKQEVENTIKIFELIDMSFDQRDWATWNFLQWFAKEQRKDERLILDLIDKIKLADGNNLSDVAQYILDKDFNQLRNETLLAEEQIN